MNTLPTPETVQEAAQQLSRSFVHDKRNNDSEFVKLVSSAPAWMTEVIYTVHGDKLPDDTVYAFCEKAADALADGDENYPEELDLGD